ncbi:sensor histidine kinase [Heyndrickxia camelliae]|uniref:histidine kinase n=1 Tax=Heyndrickxia camelliae TaxID=1707093 RepID=A0A2N3LJR6_9BACI|nr:sensor histidine kinase [Heyndrickxia camelliae]PKR84846.1 histidine kinase [Heyndrickxia camelliae]
MIRKYLMERWSWIVLFLILQLLIIFIAFIDSTIPLTSALYIVFLSCIIFFIFVSIRYQKETKFFKSLEEWETGFDMKTVVTAESPFEKIAEDSIINQAQHLKKDASLHLLSLEKEKDELLSWIHEVKTPLTAMHLIIDRIENEKLKAQLLHEWLRIHLLLDTHLHQKRIPFMENDLYIDKIDLHTLIVNEIKTLQSWCMHKGIGFEMDLKVSEVISDGKWLAFIIRQLLTNAVKYSDASDIIIKTYENNEQTFLEIQDFGRGIDPKDLPRIFDKGFTSTSDHQNHAATGMGLYLAKNAANSLHISINVDSKLGAGTTFMLCFPRQNAFHQVMSM